MSLKPLQNRQIGLTLIELLIALGIGSLLILGVLGVYISNTEAASVERALGRLQQSGRAAVDMITDDIRQAGYIGCNSIGGNIDVAASGTRVQRILAYEADGSDLTPSPDNPANQVAAVVKSSAIVGNRRGSRAGSDVLVVDYVDYFGDDLFDPGVTFNALDTTVTNLGDGLDDGDGDPVCDVVAGSMMLFSNCITSHLFKVSSVGACSGRERSVTFDATDNTGPGASAGFAFSEGSDVAEYQQFIWYVADTGRDLNGQNVYALYRLLSTQTLAQAEEMVEGVEFMRVEVGFRSGNTLRFLRPSLMGTVDNANWDNVEAVRIALLVQSFETVASTNDTENYALLSRSITPGTDNDDHQGGKVLRRVFTSSQSVRNTNYGTTTN